MFSISTFFGMITHFFTKHIIYSAVHGVSCAASAHSPAKSSGNSASALQRISSTWRNGGQFESLGYHGGYDGKPRMWIWTKQHPNNTRMLAEITYGSLKHGLVQGFLVTGTIAFIWFCQYIKGFRAKYGTDFE
jgi:hypothetical protein